MSDLRIRSAVDSDLPVLVQVEIEAGRLFRSVGLDEVAEHPTKEDDFREAGQWTWVAERDAEVAGYLTAEVLDGHTHIAQVSVRPSHARRGIGAQLVRFAEAWGAAAGRPSTTLTTFRDVPWNAPYYRRLGYREMRPEEIGPELAATMRYEATLPGIAAEDRCAMVRSADPAGTGAARG